jgi:hypothetical protein
MHEKTHLSHMILSHWREHCPRMVEELWAHNHLENAVQEAEERTADLLYDLLSVQKLPYQEAWEIATREWAYLPTEAPLPSSAQPNLTLLTKKDRPATSG